jgi:hypothetical protein
MRAGLRRLLRSGRSKIGLFRFVVWVRARLGKRTMIDLLAAGLKMVETAARRSGSSWFGLLNWRQKTKK